MVVEYGVDGLGEGYILIIFVCDVVIVDFRRDFVYIKRNGKEGKVDCEVVFWKMGEGFVWDVVFDLWKEGLRVYGCLGCMFGRFV